MIVRQFLQWVRTASPGERAEATSALARAYLFSDLTPDDRAAAEGAMIMLLDDPSPLVRKALAQVLASSQKAPPAVVQSLAADQSASKLPQHVQRRGSSPAGVELRARPVDEQSARRRRAHRTGADLGRGARCPGRAKRPARSVLGSAGQREGAVRPAVVSTQRFRRAAASARSLRIRSSLQRFMVNPLLNLVP